MGVANDVFVSLSLPLPSPPAANGPLTAADVHAHLNSPAMRSERDNLFQTPNLGNDPRQLQMIADLHGEIAPEGNLTDAILHLEGAYWNFGQAWQDWRRVSRLLARLPGTLVQDSLNSRLDRSNARGGRHFELSKLSMTVRTDQGTSTADFGRPVFDANNPRDVLRLNRRRHSFMDRTIGPIPCPPQGKAGEWWHPLEKWDVERRYVVRDRRADGFPGWAGISNEHNRTFSDLRLPGSVLPPVVRPPNKVTQHINRAALNKHKNKGHERHKLAQRDLGLAHGERRQTLAEAWQLGFSATKADLEALDQEDALAAASLAGIPAAVTAPAVAPAGEGDEEGEEEEEDMEEE